MEEQGTERSSSPSGSEDIDSDGDSKHDDGLENGKESDDENEENVKINDSDSDDSDDSGEEEDGSDNSGKSGENSKSDSEDKGVLVIKNESNAHETFGGYGMDGECYPLDLPLEVITTVEPTNYAYPVLKNMSNGVLTHRNIFTEFERSVLVNIINKYRYIVDTRSRTREIYLEKQNVWQQIVEEYNGMDNIMVRTEKELRKCWDNMKYRAKQAEKEMVKVEAMGHEDGDTEIKMEPLDHQLSHFTTEYDGGGDEGSWPGVEVALEDDREPALKRARQESPKLSSLLLAAAHKRSPSKKSGGGKSGTGTSHKSGGSGSGHYTLPEATKVHHVKKKSSNPMAALNMATMSEIPILPKGLASCLSITNIPNPVSASGGHLSSHGKNSTSPNSPPVQSAIKPMPSLKKMVPGKQQSSSGKNSNPRSSKKSNGLSSSKSRGHSSSYHNSLGPGHSSDHTITTISPMPAEHESERVEQLADRALNARLVTQRLEQERKEHELRMKLLEKELQAHTQQSQYWSLKLKMLRAGRENTGFGFPAATNGDID